MSPHIKTKPARGVSAQLWSEGALREPATTKWGEASLSQVAVQPWSEGALRKPATTKWGEAELSREGAGKRLTARVAARAPEAHQR